MNVDDITRAFLSAVDAAGGQAAFAAMSGMTPQQVSDYVRGKRDVSNMPLKTFLKMFPDARIDYGTSAFPGAAVLRAGVLVAGSQNNINNHIVAGGSAVMDVDLAEQVLALPGVDATIKLKYYQLAERQDLDKLQKAIIADVLDAKTKVVLLQMIKRAQRLSKNDK